MKTYENKYYKLGFENIAGLDEVGRGCWAGPLVVAIVIFPKNYINNKINDSKKINEKQRQILFEEIKNNALLVDWIIIEANEVDQLNPKKASIYGMEQLTKKHEQLIDVILIDAEKINVNKINESIIRGDSKSQSIAAASIVAKVVRDKILINELDKQYPKYFFKDHKGYGTKKHLEVLNKYGPIKNVHRFSYKPIKKIIDENCKIK